MLIRQTVCAEILPRSNLKQYVNGESAVLQSLKLFPSSLQSSSNMGMSNRRKMQELHLLTLSFHFLWQCSITYHLSIYLSTYKSDYCLSPRTNVSSMKAEIVSVFSSLSTQCLKLNLAQMYTAELINKNLGLGREIVLF